MALITPHFPLLCVVIPLFGALVCAVIRNNRTAWLLAVCSALCSFLCAVFLFIHTKDYVASYAIGGWQPPLGIEYRIDNFNAYILVLISGVGSLSLLYTHDTIIEVSLHNRPWFFVMVLLCLTGLMGMTATGDAFNLFVFMEIASLSSYVLIASGKKREALVAAYQYLIAGTIGATFYIIGIGFLYISTGTLNIADLTSRLASIKTTAPVLTGVGFLIVGLSIKAAIFPLHAWLPNAYRFAPVPASAFFSGTATKVALYILLRFIFGVLGVQFFLGAFGLYEVTITLSLGAILFGSIIALFQKNLRRMLAYSSIAQMGYITLGAALANENGLTGALIHIIGHGLTKAGLFFVAGNLLARLGSDNITDLAGAGRRMPWTVGSFIIFSFSMLGLPGTVGFLGKWYIALAAIERGSLWLAIIVILTSLMTLLYMGRFIETAYFPSNDEKTKSLAGSAPWNMGLSLAVLTGLCLWLGIDTAILTDKARAAALFLLGTSLQ